MVQVKFSSKSEIIVHDKDCGHIEGSETETLEYDGDELPDGMRLCEHCQDDVIEKISAQQKRLRRPRNRR